MWFSWNCATVFAAVGETASVPPLNLKYLVSIPSFADRRHAGCWTRVSDAKVEKWEKKSISTFAAFCRFQFHPGCENVFLGVFTQPPFVWPQGQKRKSMNVMLWIPGYYSQGCTITVNYSLKAHGNCGENGIKKKTPHLTYVYVYTINSCWESKQHQMHLWNILNRFWKHNGNNMCFKLRSFSCHKNQTVNQPFANTFSNTSL